jgi:hypothetical protein
LISAIGRECIEPKTTAVIRSGEVVVGMRPFRAKTTTVANLPGIRGYS